MPAKQPTQLDYQLDVLLRQYCRSAEENEILIEEMMDLQYAFGEVLKENADLRFRLVALGVVLPAPDYILEEGEDEDEVVELTK